MFPSLSRAQRPRKHFESEGALAKRGTFVYDQNQTILCRSQAERNFLKIWNLYNVGNGLYRVFTTAKRALSFQQRRAFIQEILFSFCKWGTFSKSGGGGKMPPLPPRFRGPCPGFKGYLYKLLGKPLIESYMFGAS